MKRTVAVIQARMGSRRLPGKILEPLHDDVSLLAYQCRRLRHTEGVDELVIATTTARRDDVIAELASAEGIRVCRGSEHDVLGRFVLAADMSLADTLVRITSDSPFRDPGVIARCVAEHRAHGAEYTRPQAGHLPKGLRAEIVETRVLRQIDSDRATTDREREHVTIRIRENPDAYRCLAVGFADNLHHPEFDLSVDTADELEFVRMIHSSLQARAWPADIDHICALLTEMALAQPQQQGLAS
ncbi:cytidylyltransferase domain-containing protein [Maricaulis sp.]|uniref:cytidylyltransferase domain-containing protein n=1 Tax=Maricaulis sp. TaxID=1486257 RepID=UPI003A9333E9